MLVNIQKLKNTLFLLQLLLVLTSRLTSGQIPSRCEYICQNDDSCKSGRCVLTECSDTIACYRYCLTCSSHNNFNTTCFETGAYCYYRRTGVVNTSNRPKVYSTFISLIILSTVKFY